MRDSADVSVARGSIVIYRIFDVAEEFNLERIESAVSAPPDRGPARLKVARSTGQALILRDAPVTLALGNSDLRIGDATHNSDLFARIWSYGVVSLQFRIAIPPGTTWPALVELAACVEDVNDIDAVAQARVRDLAQSLRTAATMPHDPQGMEDYVIYLLERVDGIAEISHLSKCVDIPALILGEPHVELSENVRRPILDSSLAYSTRDLAVIDWNSALVIDQDGSRDVADMIEFAATHLMEFRYFDTLLDERLTALYAAIEEHHRLRSFFRNASERLSHEASALYIEFSEHVERIENSLKFVGDFYLASVFRRAALRFQLKEWEDNVLRKVNALAQVSEVLADETNTRRSQLLEIIIILLILYEIVQATLMR